MIHSHGSIKTNGREVGRINNGKLARGNPVCRNGQWHSSSNRRTQQSSFARQKLCENHIILTQFVWMAR